MKKPNNKLVVGTGDDGYCDDCVLCDEMRKAEKVGKVISIDCPYDPNFEDDIPIPTPEELAFIEQLTTSIPNDKTN